MIKTYEYLDKINFPSDLKKISESKLQKVADELPASTAVDSPNLI